MDARLYGIYVDACGNYIDDYEHYRERAKKAKTKLKQAQLAFIKEHLKVDPGNVYEWKMNSGACGKAYLASIIIEDDLITLKWKKLKGNTNLPSTVPDKSAPEYYDDENIKYKLCINREQI
jgi:hypothetical protein